MSENKNGENKGRNKKRTGAVIAALIAVVVIAGAAVWYTSRIDFKLQQAGYTKQQIQEIKTAFTAEEQKVLAANRAQADIIAIAQDERFQADKLTDYLKGLAEGKDADALLEELDPWVIAIRAAEGFREEYYDDYLRVYPSGEPRDAAEKVAYINRSLDMINVEGYNVLFADEYEARYQESPQSSLEDIVKHVNKIHEYKDQANFIESKLERYEAYRAEDPGLDLEEVIRRVNAGVDKPFYTDIQPADMSKGYLVLVNKYFTVDREYEPELEKLTGYGYGSLEKTAADWFKKMVDAAKADGITLRSVSPFRTWGTQYSFYWGYVNSAGQAKADTYSARPGHSEHETGLAVDINTADTADHFENTKEYAWLIENCYKYGYILRYLPEKEYLTGYIYEPWHYRYVGVDYAQKIMESGLTFEEWYALNVE